MAQQSRGGLNPFYLVLGVGAAAGIAVLAWLVLKPRGVSIPANVVVTTADTSGFRGYLLGDNPAAVEVVEYADYQCPACADFDVTQFPDIRDRLIQGGRVRWRYRDFPLEMHQNARFAAHATACADDQGKYWAFHKVVYETQQDWEFEKDPMGRFQHFADSVGADGKAWGECMRSAKHAGRIQASFDEGLKLGVNSTPTFLIGGRLFPGKIPYDRFKAIIDSISPPPAK